MAGLVSKHGLQLYKSTNIAAQTFLQLKQCSLQLTAVRYLQSKRLSRSLEFFTSNDREIPTLDSDLKVTKHLRDNQRPLVLLYAWLMAEDKHVHKYTKFYTDLDFDVLKVKTSPFDVLKPTSGTQITASNILEFLHTNPSYKSILVHAFSVGAYAFSEALVQIASNMSVHGSLLDRFCGQVLDSPADIQVIPVGFSRAVTHNKIMQAYMQAYLEWHLKSHYNEATAHYEEGSRKIHQCFINTPSLLLFSKADPVSNDVINNNLADEWKMRGIQVFTKCWETSRHVSHYQMHRQEYEKELHAFLEFISLLNPISATLQKGVSC